MIKRMFKWVVVVIGSLLGLLVAAYGLLVLVNLQKEPLHPEVEAFLRPEPITVSPERNGFYFWTGIAAPTGQDPTKYGQRIIAALGRQSPAAADPAGARPEQELRLDYDRKILCHRENRTPCLELARQNAAQVRELARGNAELLRRYVALLQFDHFATDRPVLLTPDWTDSFFAQGDLGSLFTLARTLDALDVSEGRSSEVLDRLVARVGFLRRMYANSTYLLDRSIAHRWLEPELEFLVEVAVAEPDSAKAAAAQIAAITAPMTIVERSPLRWIRYEFSNEAASIDTGNPRGWPYSVCKALLGRDLMNLYGSGKLVDRCGRWDVRMLALAGAPLMDRSAVLNRWFAVIRQLRRIDGLDTLSYWGGSHEVDTAGESQGEADRWWHLRNPMGRWMGLTRYTTFVWWGGYLRRGIDLDRLLALTRRAIDLAQHRVKEGEIDAYLKRSEFVDPATGKPLSWDAARSQVFFVPLDVRRWAEPMGGIDGRAGLSLK